MKLEYANISAPAISLKNLSTKAWIKAFHKLMETKDTNSLSLEYLTPKKTTL